MTTVTAEAARANVSPGTVVAPGLPTVSAARQLSNRNEMIERALIDASTRGPVLTLFGTAVGWLLISTLLGFIASMKLHSPDFLGNISFLTYGRVYTAFTNAFIYGWCSLAGMGVAVWLMARLCRVSVRAPGVLAFGALF